MELSEIRELGMKGKELVMYSEAENKEQMVNQRGMCERRRTRGWAAELLISF